MATSLGSIGGGRPAGDLPAGLLWLAGGLVLGLGAGVLLRTPEAEPAEPICPPCTPPTPSPPPAPGQPPPAPSPPPTPVPPTPTGVVWTGSFDGFGTAAWAQAWGALKTASWGMSFPHPAADPGASLGAALLVPYAAGSSAPSCSSCPDPRGVQWYTDLGQMGLASLKSASQLRLTYRLKLPTDFSWGGAHVGGKLPGLYGGAPGTGTGGKHTGGWTTRYMWRKGGAGEVYLEGPSGVTYGIDLGAGAWTFQPDAQWHTISQLVDLAGQTVTVWYDGARVLFAPLTGIPPAGFSGIMFSTFFGGHDTTWGPTHDTSAMFADFALSTS